jgi:hypothetical protein
VARHDILNKGSTSAEERIRRLQQSLGQDLQRLSPDTRRWVEREVARWHAEVSRDACQTPLEAMPAMLAQVRAQDYLSEPVGIRQFIEDPHYLGSLGKDFVYPRIVTDLEELFEGDYHEVVLAGSQGWGKSRMAEVGIAYEVYQLSCLKDPAATYGLMTGSALAFLNVSVRLEQAIRVLFKGLFSILRASPYFREVFPYAPNLTTEIRFPRGIICYPVAASEESIMGEGIFSACIDEVNFMDTVERSRRTAPGAGRLYDQGETVYNRIARRIRTRMNQRGKLPGHIWLISSARYPGDFTERKEAQAKTDPRIFVRHYALWDTKPKTVFMPQTFQVELGTINHCSRVLDGTETDVDRERVIDVPMDFREEFERDPDACVRDYAGVSTLSITPFMPRRDLIRQMFELGAEAGLRHPFTRQEVTLQAPDMEMQHLVPEHLHWIQRPKLNAHGAPIVDRGQVVTERVLFPALYYAHVDLSRTIDATGLAIGHVIDTKKVVRFDDQTGRNTEEIKPIIRVDLVLRVVAPRRGEIDIPRIRSLFYQLSRPPIGMQFGKITFDTFGSQESVKTLNDNGYSADTFSVDVDMTAFETLKTAIYDRRVWCCENPKLEMELAQLERTPNKIDHPNCAGASKDLADCLAAVVYHCEEGWRRGQMSAGMFKVGIVERPGAEWAVDIDDRQVRASEMQFRACPPTLTTSLELGSDVEARPTTRGRELNSFEWTCQHCGGSGVVTLQVGLAAWGFVCELDRAHSLACSGCDADARESLRVRTRDLRL